MIILALVHFVTKILLEKSFSLKKERERCCIKLFFDPLSVVYPWPTGPVGTINVVMDVVYIEACTPLPISRLTLQSCLFLHFSRPPPFFHLTGSTCAGRHVAILNWCLREPTLPYVDDNKDANRKVPQYTNLNSSFECRLVSS